VGVRAGWRGLRRTAGLAHAAGAAVTGLAPTGRSSLVPVRDALDAAHPGGWPDGTWMVTWDVVAGRRVVLGRDAIAEVGTAASAAAAVPGVFAPVGLDGARLVDAGAVSSTHADLVADRHAGLVLVSAPMAAAPGAYGGVDAPSRWLATRQLAGEVSTLRAAGHDPVVLAPPREVLRAMPANPLVDDRVAAARVVAATRPWARERIEAHLAAVAAGGRRVA
jgi:predicted acylesterase/phospholipase RssA